MVLRRMPHVEPHPRSGVYRVRVVVPPDLRDALKGKSAFTRTLGLKCRREAERRAPAVIAEIYGRIERARVVRDAERAGVPAGPTLNYNEGLDLVRRWQNETLVRIATKIRDHGPGADLTRAWGLLGPDGARAFVEEQERQVYEFDAGDNDPHEMFQPWGLLGAILSEAGHVVPRGHPLGPALRQAMEKELWEAVREIAARERELRDGRWRLDLLPPALRQPGNGGTATPAPTYRLLDPSLQPPTAALAPDASLRLAEIHERYLCERRPGAKMADDQRRIIRLLIEHLGYDPPVRSLTKAQLVRFKEEVLLAMPRAGWRREWMALKAPELVEALKGRDDVRRVSTSTVRRQLLGLGTIFAWAVDNNYMTVNPALRIAPNRPPREGVERGPFSPEDIRRIFSSPRFTGYLSEERWWLPGTMLGRDHRFWLPVLGLWTGARATELGQLLTADIKTEDGITYIDITETDDAGRSVKRLKNAASWRKVPIHPKLLETGFDDYVSARRAAGDEKLFPELWDATRGFSIDPFSKFFARLLDRIGITSPAMTFHSFRHTMKDALRRATRDEEVRDRIQGHANNSVGRRYGVGALRPLADAMEAVAYPTFPRLPDAPRVVSKPKRADGTPMAVANAPG